ncbi:MAG: AI-2E family transporter [Burkholderiaceae bacterium]
MVAKISSILGTQAHPNWQTIREATVDRVNVEKLIGTVLGSVGSIAGTVFAVVIYAVFLMAERNDFPKKLAAAIPEYRRVEHTCAILADINQRIGDYLAVKTLINAILALISFAILWFWNVDFAVFWALLIGLLNYIPYVGSLLAVVFPVLLALAQFGSLQTALIIAALLTATQMWVGNALEPRMIGNRVNLSPFVVLVALSVWSSLWGLAGAILAIPMTSMLSIVLGAFAATRPLAVMLTNDLAAFHPAVEAGEDAP